MTIKKKGMESFAIVLGIGITLFFLAFFVLSLVPEREPFRSPSSILPGLGFGTGTAAGEFGDTIVIYESDVGRLGALQTKHAIASLGSFEVGYALGKQTIAQKPEVVIKNGWFSKNEELAMSFNGTETTNATLIFRVANSNLFNDLIVVFNGKTVYSNLTVNGSYSVEISGTDIKTAANTITVKAKSSGFKFWAPTIYILKDVKLEIDKYQFKEKTLPFVVQQEVFEKWIQGSFVSKVPKLLAEGNLIVDINGHNIFKDRVYSRLLSISFAKFSSAVVQGENLVRFYADGKGYYNLQDVLLDIEYSGGSAAATIKSFIVPAPHYDAIASGEYIPKLTFEFKEISQAPVTVTFNEKDYVFPNLALQFRSNETGTGTAELNLTVNDLYKDFNIIKFRTDGVYDIFKVRFIGQSTKPPSKAGSFFKRLY